jgi:hypothetical protein
MARSVKKARNDAGYTLFDIVYQDGAQTSNRKAPHAEVEDVNDEGALRAFFEAQDRKIAEMSGNPRGPIKTMTRSAK